MGRCFKCPIHGVAAGVVTLMVLVAAAAPLAAAQPQTRVSPSTVGTGFAEPRFTSYEYDFGAEHGFGASARVPKPIVSAEIVENLKEEADAGSRGEDRLRAASCVRTSALAYDWVLFCLLQIHSTSTACCCTTAKASRKTDVLVRSTSARQRCKATRRRPPTLV